MAYTGSKFKLKFCVNAETLLSDLNINCMAIIVHSQLRINNHPQSFNVGNNTAFGKKTKYKGINKVKIANPPDSSYNIIICGSAVSTCFLLKTEKSEASNAETKPTKIPI